MIICRHISVPSEAEYVVSLNNITCKKHKSSLKPNPGDHQAQVQCSCVIVLAPVLHLASDVRNKH